MLCEMLSRGCVQLFDVTSDSCWMWYIGFWATGLHQDLETTILDDTEWSIIFGAPVRTISTVPSQY